MREIFKSGSVRGLIVTLGLLPQKKKGVLWALLDINTDKMKRAMPLKIFQPAPSKKKSV